MAEHLGPETLYDMPLSQHNGDQLLRGWLWSRDSFHTPHLCAHNHSISCRLELPCLTPDTRTHQICRSRVTFLRLPLSVCALTPFTLGHWKR